MNYLLIDSQSIEELINARQYQSTEFDEGKAETSHVATAWSPCHHYIRSEIAYFQQIENAVLRSES